MSLFDPKNDTHVKGLAMAEAHLLCLAYLSRHRPAEGIKLMRNMWDVFEHYGMRKYDSVTYHALRIVFGEYFRHEGDFDAASACLVNSVRVQTDFPEARDWLLGEFKKLTDNLPGAAEVAGFQEQYLDMAQQLNSGGGGPQPVMTVLRIPKGGPIPKEVVDLFKMMGMPMSEQPAKSDETLPEAPSKAP